MGVTAETKPTLSVNLGNGMLRTFIVCFTSLFISSIAFADGPHGEHDTKAHVPKVDLRPPPGPGLSREAEMRALAREAVKPLKPSHVDDFVKAVDQYTKWVIADPKRIAILKETPVMERQTKLNELMGEEVGLVKDLSQLVMRMVIATEISKPNSKAKLEDRLRQINAQLAAIDKGESGLPESQRALYRQKAVDGIEMMEAMLKYPDASVALYRKNEVRIIMAQKALQATDELLKEQHDHNHGHDHGHDHDH